MLLPIGTDAPVYHFPWMTIVLIVGNVFSFVLTGSGSRPEGWLLQFGNGLHPVEWLAWNFLHFGFMHLLGNMFFLWAFGLVVEGKLGWWKYLLVYLGVGIVGGFVVQSIMLGTDVPKLPDRAQMTAQMVPRVLVLGNQPPAEDDLDFKPFDLKNLQNDPRVDPRLREVLKKQIELAEGADEAEALSIPPPGAGGASLAIYGLVAIALVWAPKNEIHIVGFLVYRPVSFDIDILYVSGFYLAEQFLWAFESGFSMGSEVLHLVGAVLGFGVGMVMLKAKWVDCENWDLLAVMKGTHGAYGDTSTRLGADLARYRMKMYGESVSEPEEEVKPKSKEPRPLDPEEIETRRSAALQRMRAAIEQENVLAALSEYRKVQSLDRTKKLEGADLKLLVNGLCKGEMWSDAVPVLEECVKRMSTGSEKLRITLASIYVDHLGRPSAALRSLKPINQKSLAAPLDQQYNRLVKQAKQMIAEGVLEFDEGEAAASDDVQK
jgi:membrane associated rhomboid family serine protease